MGMGEGDLRYFLNEWELGICMLLSLFLQILLIFAGPLRRIISSKWLDILLWSAYLLADATAIFAVGLIASKQAVYSKHYLDEPPNSMLHTFWAAFLLAHLGGPDPITAFALEDNELWLRHLFSLFTQCIAVGYVFYQSLTPNKLLVPSLLMFLCGIIKYAERTYALYCASNKTFRDSILRAPLIPVKIPLIDALPGLFPRRYETDLKPLEVVQRAFRYFTKYKALVVDLLFKFEEHKRDRDYFFRKISSKDAFGVVEVELNFLYDTLFTKLPVVYHRVGLSCRAVSFGCIVTSMVLFHYADKKHFNPKEFEVGITYILLVGGIVLEVIAFLMLVFSDWTVVKLQDPLDIDNPVQPWKRQLMEFIVNANIRRGKIICWLLNIGGVRGSRSGTISEPTNSRWAESISGYNFIHYCLHKRSSATQKIYDLCGVTDFVDGMVYVKQHHLPSYVKDFIFDEVKNKSRMASNPDTTKKILSSKGESVIESGGDISAHLFTFVEKTEYDESLLMWHIATELCYNDKDDENIHLSDHLAQPPEHHRNIAKLISDYMMYLLVTKPGIIAALSKKVHLKFRETCNEATSTLDRILSTEERQLPKAGLQVAACAKFIDHSKNTTWIAHGWSIMPTAAGLAVGLKKIEVRERWKIISRVWMELLLYGACRIRPNAHAQQLSKGGELITLVWLLMTHYCLVDQFESPPRGLYSIEAYMDALGN